MHWVVTKGKYLNRDPLSTHLHWIEPPREMIGVGTVISTENGLGWTIDPPNGREKEEWSMMGNVTISLSLGIATPEKIRKKKPLIERTKKKPS